MNLKSILSRTLPLIIVLVLIIGVAVSCTVFSFDREVPSINDKEGIYATYKHEKADITVTNDEMYQLLKNNGLTFAVNWVDTTILKAEMADENQTYFAKAEADHAAVVAKKRLAIFGDEDLADIDLDDGDAIEESFEDYLETMKTSGYKGIDADYNLLLDESKVEEAFNKLTAEEKDIYALQVAKELYAWDALDEEIAEQNKKAEEDEDEDPYFTDDDIESYYNSNYENSYWAIVIPYTSTKAVNNALAQLGIEIVKDGTTTLGWGWSNKEGEAKDNLLTASEIFDAFIKLYNNANAYKQTGNGEVIPTATVNYAALATDNKFDATKAEVVKDYFFYTYDELNSINSSVRSRINGTALSDFYDASSTATGTDVKGYTKSAYTASSTYYLLLKLDVVEIEKTNPLWADEEETVMNEAIKNEIIEKLTEEARTDTVVKNKMAELRKEYGLMFYDTALETSYTSSYDTSFEGSKKENKSNILKVVINGEDVFYSTETYFNELSVRMASSYILDVFMKEIVLLSEYNKVVENYRPDMTYKQIKKAVIDDEKWNELLENVQALKNNFAGNAFSSYGYPSSYGWKNFLRDFYLAYYGTLITSDEDLMVYYIYQDALSNMADASNDYLVNTDLQAEFERLMQEEENKYFNVGGYHLLISVYEEDGSTMINPLDEESDVKWTEAQINGAKELHAEIVEKILTATNPETVLEDFVTAYNAAPYYTLYGTDGKTLSTPTLDNQPELNDKGKAPYLYTGLAGELSLPEADAINLSKYKSLGLSVKYESLSSFGAGKMVEEFETYAKDVWTSLRSEGLIQYNNADKKWETIEPQTPAKDQYLVTEYGYHVFVVTSAEGFAGTTPTESTEADATLSTPAEVKKEFIEYFVPTTALLKKYVEIIESDEYKAVLENDNYSSGDEDDYLKEKGFTAHQIASIENYYSAIATELTGSYVTSLNLILGLDSAKLVSASLNSDAFATILKTQKEYCVNNMTYLGKYFADKYNIELDAE